MKTYLLGAYESAQAQLSNNRKRVLEKWVLAEKAESRILY